MSHWKATSDTPFWVCQLLRFRDVSATFPAAFPLGPGNFFTTQASCIQPQTLWWNTYSRARDLPMVLSPSFLAFLRDSIWFNRGIPWYFMVFMVPWDTQRVLRSLQVGCSDLYGRSQNLPDPLAASCSHLFFHTPEPRRLPVGTSSLASHKPLGRSQDSILQTT